MKNWLLSLLIFLIYRSLSMTWRIRVEEPPEMIADLKARRPIIFTHWHGDELVLLRFIGHYRVGTIVSTSQDGELMNNVARWMGARTTRGSSTRGAVGALKGLIRLIRDGANCSFAVDGPKGPVYKVKPGAFEISRAMDLPIYWAGIGCDRAWHFPKSWNKTYLPKPFARILLKWSGPMRPVPKDVDPRDPGLASRLEDQLNAAKQQALVSIAEH